VFGAHAATDTVVVVEVMWRFSSHLRAKHQAPSTKLQRSSKSEAPTKSDPGAKDGLVGF